MTIQIAIRIASFLFVCFYAAVRLRFELQMMQQNSYRPERYFRWLKGDVGSVVRVIDLLIVVVLIMCHFTRWEVYATGAVGLLVLYKGIRELRVKYKKPLVFTARAVRIYLVGLVVFEDAGHYSFLERPAQFAAILDSFLKS